MQYLMMANRLSVALTSLVTLEIQAAEPKMQAQSFLK